MTKIVLYWNNNYMGGPKLELIVTDKDIKYLKEESTWLEDGYEIIDYVRIPNDAFGKLIKLLEPAEIDPLNGTAFGDSLETIYKILLEKIIAICEKEIGKSTLIFKKKSGRRLKSENFAITGDGQILVKKNTGNNTFAWINYTEPDINISLSPKTWDDVMRINKAESEYLLKKKAAAEKK